MKTGIKGQDKTEYTGKKAKYRWRKTGDKNIFLIFNELRDQESPNRTRRRYFLKDKDNKPLNLSFGGTGGKVGITNENIKDTKSIVLIWEVLPVFSFRNENWNSLIVLSVWKMSISQDSIFSKWISH